MKKIITFILTVVGVFMLAQLFGQESPWNLWLNADTDDFATIQQNVENYFADKDKDRGSGYKQWKRWEYINKARLSADGKVFNYTARNFDEYHDYIENTSRHAGFQINLRQLVLPRSNRLCRWCRLEWRSRTGELYNISSYQCCNTMGRLPFRRLVEIYELRNRLDATDRRHAKNRCIKHGG